MSHSSPICDHLNCSRTELVALIAIRQLRSSRGILARFGRSASCPQCLQTITEILSELRFGEKHRAAVWKTLSRCTAIHSAASDEAASHSVLATEDAEAADLLAQLESRYERLRRAYSLEIAVTGAVHSAGQGLQADICVQRERTGWSLSVCGQGGNCPRRAVLLARTLSVPDLIRCLDRFLAYYVATADPLTRTTPWYDMLEDGANHLCRLIVNDQLRVGAELDELFQHLNGAGRGWVLQAGTFVKSVESAGSTPWNRTQRLLDDSPKTGLSPTGDPADTDVVASAAAISPH